MPPSVCTRARFGLTGIPQVNNTIPVDVTATYSSPVSPPPYMVGMVEIELDKETGAVKILDYQAVLCHTPVAR